MVTKAQKKEIEKIVDNHILQKFLIWMAIFGFLFGISVWKIYESVEKTTIDRISQQFEEPRINQILTEVASSEAKAIISDAVKPHVMDVKKEINYFQDYIDGMRLSFSKEYDVLAKEVETLKIRNHLILLADNAMNDGDRGSYNELVAIYKNHKDKNISRAAKAEMLRVKTMFVSGSRFGGVGIESKDEEGNVLKNEEIPTKTLLKDLIHNKNLVIRAKAAKLLAHRKEAGVPEALINSFEIENNLIVLKNALKSFESITGFNNADVFEYERALIWWKENKESYYQSIEQE